MMKDGVWVLAALLAAVAGWTDWRSRRIPNWLTISGLCVGIAANSLAWGLRGTKDALLGAGLGLALLLPLVLIRSLGGGDWKLAGAVGAFTGPHHLISVLVFSALVAGVMAVILIIWKNRAHAGGVRDISSAGHRGYPRQSRVPESSVWHSHGNCGYSLQCRAGTCLRHVEVCSA